MNIGEILINKYVFAYLATLGGLLYWFRVKEANRAKTIQDARDREGLGPEILAGPKTRLQGSRDRALKESELFLALALILPFLLSIFGAEDKEKTGLATAFIAIFAWILVSGTDLAKSLVGGLAFRILNPLKPAFGLHDRVTIKGISGKVVDIGVFHVRLQTPDDDLICIPTSSLWSETLISANAGARSSLCVMAFHLMPDTDMKQRKNAENIIWDAVQASVYFDPDNPLQIYCSQTSSAIVLTAKAYVASTYREPDFKSDVTNRVLDGFSSNRIHLSGSFYNTRQLSQPQDCDTSDKEKKG